MYVYSGSGTVATAAAQPQPIHQRVDAAVQTSAERKVMIKIDFI